MKATRILVFFSCLLWLGCGGLDDDRITAGKVTDSTSLKEFVEYAAESLENSTTIEEALQLINEFREEGGDWNDGSTYLVLLTGSGSVYTHAKNRSLEDQDWFNLQDSEGEPVGEQFLRDGGGFVEYKGEDGDAKVSYAYPTSGPPVPLTRLKRNLDEQKFILVGGFDYEPDSEEQDLYAEIPGAEEHLRPKVEAGNVDKEDELKRFVNDARHFFTTFMNDPDVDIVQLRRYFRVDEGPWRDGSTYIYIMDDRGNVVFNGGNRNIEQTNLSDHPEVGEVIREIICVAKKPGGGFIRYNWNDPRDPSDDPPDGGAGGSSPKLGYAIGIPLDKESEGDQLYYIFGSGLYLGQDPPEDPSVAEMHPECRTN